MAEKAQTSPSSPGACPECRGLNAMSRIESHRVKFPRLVSVIDEIAVQNQLLALKGVEAARAGEQEKALPVAPRKSAIWPALASAASDVKELITNQVPKCQAAGASGQ